LLRKWQRTLGDTFFAAHCSSGSRRQRQGSMWSVVDRVPGVQRQPAWVAQYRRGVAISPRVADVD